MWCIQLICNAWSKYFTNVILYFLILTWFFRSWKVKMIWVLEFIIDVIQALATWVDFVYCVWNVNINRSLNWHTANWGQFDTVPCSWPLIRFSLRPRYGKALYENRIDLSSPLSQLKKENKKRKKEKKPKTIRKHISL